MTVTLQDADGSFSRQRRGRRIRRGWRLLSHYSSMMAKALQSPKHHSAFRSSFPERWGRDVDGAVLDAVRDEARVGRGCGEMRLNTPK